MLTRSQCAMMRAIAITSIVLHNFCHWLAPMVKENEYNFSELNVRRLMVEMSHPSWELIAHLFSFFGHYGVVVFVFLSAYGLVKKYETPEYMYGKNESAWTFVKAHWIKLFLMMVAGYSAFVLVDYMTPGPRHYEFWNVIGGLGMFSNLYNEPGHNIWPGPYWYFGLTLQLYLAYRFIFYPGKTSLGGLTRMFRNPLALVAVAAFFVIWQVQYAPESKELNWYRYNCMGNMPVFIFGLLYARYDMSKYIEGKTMRAVVAAIALILVVVFSLNYTMWLVAPFLVVISSICIVKLIPDSISVPLVWLGGLSSYIFICHPITRKVLIPISHRGDIFAGLALYAVATIMLAIVFRQLMNRRQQA